MSKLESLRITECPAAFAEFARKHNALVDMLAGATGANGIKVTVADNNLVLEIDAQASLTISGLTVNGEVSATGDITATGNLVAGTELEVGGHLYNDELLDVCDGGVTVTKRFLTEA